MFLLIIATIIAIEHIGIGLFEMFGSTKKQAESFGMSEEFIARPEAKTALANQGIYNLMLGAIIILTGFLIDEPRVEMTLYGLFIFVVGIFGAVTASKKIWLMQVVPGIILIGVSILSMIN